MDSNLNIFLNALRDAINNDPNQFNRAKNDSMYDAFRPQVDALLDEMYQEVKTNAEKEYRYLDYATLKMKRWFDSEYSYPENIPKYEELLSNIHNAKEKLKNRNYMSHVDAVNIMNEAKKIKDEIHASVKNNLDSMRKELNHNKTVLNNDYFNSKDGLIRKKKTGLYERIIVAWGLIIITTYAVGTSDTELDQGLSIIIGTFFSFAALMGYLTIYNSHEDKFGFDEIAQSMVIALIIMIIIGIIVVVLFLISEIVSTIFLILVMIVLIFWPFIIQDNKTKSKISKLEKDEKAIKEHISILSHKFQIAKEAILLQPPNKELTGIMKLLVKSTESSNPHDKREAIEEVSQQTDVLLNSFKRALENSKKK